MKRGFTLLLAEDDEDDIVLFERALKEGAARAGVPVRLEIARDGGEVLAYFNGLGEFGDRQEHPFPQLLVTDLKMPRLNGLDVLRWMKANDDYQFVPKILLTGSCEEGDVVQAYRLGVNTYFQKPHALADLKDLLYHIVSYWAHTERPAIPRVFAANALTA